MEMKHTPGPWHVGAGDRRTGHAVKIGTGELLVGGVGLASLANASLIAAAPELLQSLVTMVQMMDCGDESGAGSPWHTEAKAAIAKAISE